MDAELSGVERFASISCRKGQSALRRLVFYIALSKNILRTVTKCDIYVGVRAAFYYRGKPHPGILLRNRNEIVKQWQEH